MSPLLPIAIIAALAISEAVAIRRRPERSFVLLVTKDKVALLVVAAWWIYAVAVSIPDGNLFGGALFGFLSACLVGTLVATVRRTIARRRVTRSTS